MRWCMVIFLPFFLFNQVYSEILTPPYFNLAEGKEITASATCGVDTTGPELYCKLVGANADQKEDINLIQGQVCDYCDPNDPEKSHPPEHAVDGMETWWQSPPLSRGMKYNEVNLTINLGQEFHVAYVYVRMANSPRPGVWVLEKSKDYGQTWSPWQYFSDSESDCLTYFGVDSHTPITRDDSVICTTEYSKIVPLEGGEIPISILNNRPSAKHYFNSTLLQEWTRATNVRFRFLRTKNLLGHLMSVARQDPTVTRRYFYSIKDISIGGRCMCNGHADTCDILDPNMPKKLVCRCQHNTCGPQCASCCKGFEQKKWRISTGLSKFTCEPCNCFGHTNECEYDPEIDEKHLSLDIHGNYEGGGVCQNCRHNTEGINCNRCKEKFYRPERKHWNDTDVCQPCDCNHFFSTGNCAESTGKCECRPEYQAPNCDSCSYGYFGYPNCRPCECHLNGTDGYHCEAIEGSCPCKPNYAGHYCNLCAEGYFNFPECLACNCNSLGSLSDICDVLSGNCTCKNNYGGRTCDICEDGYYNYPECTYCNCDSRGTEPGVCDKTDGHCLCKEGYGGERCDRCIDGYFGYPNCKPCNCSAIGSSFIGCDVTGKCSCLANFAGKTCDQCSPGYYKFPDCINCDCDSHGSIGVSCDLEGKCQCKENFDGPQCNQCKEGFYNFPRCEGCNCDPAGVVETFMGCGSLPVGELCKCKERVEGRICNQCKPLFWNLQANNPDGCEECQCNIPGVIGSIGECDSKSGQCICKPSVTERSCSRCVDGSYNLQEENVFGCSDCACDVGGSISRLCDKITGQCPCQARVTGQTCKEPLKAHYFPTLHQFQYEAEDGITPSNNPVRYGFSDEVFPGYSWKGYAVFGLIQDEIIHFINVHKSSLYRMVLRYINPNNEAILGTITITPDNPSEVEQQFMVHLKPTTNPSFVTVAGAQGIIPSSMVMDPGHWTIRIATKKSLFLDYFVLLPAEYYEATILTEDVNIPCEIGYLGLCRHYGYPNLTLFNSVHGAGGFLSKNGVRESVEQYLTDRETLDEIEEERLPLISNEQNEVNFEMRITKPGAHVLVVTYITPKEENSTSSVTIEAGDWRGKANLNPCKYTSICRQVVIDSAGRVAIMNFPTNYIGLKIIGEVNKTIAIDSIIAIPQQEWSLDYIKPKSACVRKNKKCVQGSFPGAADAKKIEFESDLNLGSTPEWITNKNSKFIYLYNENADIHAKVPYPGAYIFVVQYYQPDYPEFDLEVLIQNGKYYEAKVPVPHCPSSSGCRSLIRQIDGETRFVLEENVSMNFNEATGKGIWIDYVLVVPADQYNDNILRKLQFDQTEEFIKKCGSNHFYVNVTDEGLCRDATFSLTTHYNNRALPCNCDIEGTMSFECEKFGGQCPCKPNIIGRRCETCKTGFYGFPDCKPCNCPSTAICEPERGECICPSKVTGEKCDQCEIGTYGYHPIIGCEDCNCAHQGVLNGNLQCDLLNGSCSCKENVVGRRCDKCLPGYSQFPHCEKCDCDNRGTTDDICDQFTAECYCKTNVQGLACDVCKEGTFDLQIGNEEGCSKCFCFGKTNRCVSSNLYRTFIMNMENWESVAVIEKHGNVTNLESLVKNVNETSTVLDFAQSETMEKIVFFTAPDNYLGKKLTSYGGWLNYTIMYSTGPFGNAVDGPDVILRSGDMLLFYHADEQPYQFTNYRASLELVEKNFLALNKLKVTREQFLVVLENLEGIYIRATYWDQSLTAVLSYVTLDTTTTSYSHNSILASGVEQCQCPPNYQGLSCEECAPGYYRVSSGPYGGYCVRCQCHGHSDSCDVNTGVCHDCKNGTTGDHCEYCEQGYYGNATIGTPSDCLICACPLPVPSNNFATGCQVNEDGNKISCDCLPGYYGARCEACSAGYYGQPDVYNDFCKPCNCSGNIDTNDIGSCDSITGECRNCLNNTYGQACNICAPGFFGDAVDRKDCQSCLCDSCGMDQCNNYNGRCECKQNVIGDKCDRCEINHYGFDSCDGCKACDCGAASESSQCDMQTGQCRCKPGVTGRKCDKCINGYWNYGPEGCISCGCNTGYSVGVSCNTSTGQCTCLPGVIGEKCDHCPYRFVLIENDGCYQCDSCTDDLLDVTDLLSETLNPVFNNFSTVAESYFTNQRLRFFNDSVNELYPEVQLLDPSKINFVPLKQDIVRLDEEVKAQKRKVEYISDAANQWKEGAENTLNGMNELEKDVAQEIELVNDIVAEIQSLASNIQIGAGAKVEYALQVAESIIQKIKSVSFHEFRDKANDQQIAATILISEMMDYTSPVKNFSSEIQNLNGAMKTLSIKIDDLHNLAVKAEDLIRTAAKLNEENKRAAETGNIDNVKKFADETNDDILSGRDLNKKANDALDEARPIMKELANESEKIGNTINQLRETYQENEKEMPMILDLIGRAKKHADQLDLDSLALDDVLSDTRNTDAVKAVSVYQNIQNDISDAEAAAAEAIEAADQALSQSSGIDENAKNSFERSKKLLTAATESVNRTEGQLNLDLDEAEKYVSDIEGENIYNKDSLDDIDRSLEKITSQGPLLVIQTALNNADKVEYTIQQALNNMNHTVNTLPMDLKTTKQLSKDISDSIHEITQANFHLNSVDKVIPNMNSLLDELNQRQNSINSTGNDLYDKIERLKRKIANARELADRFKVGLTFFKNTTLELKNPESLPLLATSTQVSVYFRTNISNGFLMYLGNEGKSKIPRTETHDYMALTIENGYPVLLMDLGSGTTKIVNNNKTVSDNVWRQLIVERTGRNVKLILREDVGEGKEKLYVKEQSLPGSNTVFNLDLKKSKLFVGGYPPSFQIQDDVTVNYFEGEMEELVIGDVPVSFWNFVDAENNFRQAIERDKLINLESSTGYRFDGNGYAIISKKMSQLRVKNSEFIIRMNFKSLEKNGLMYLMGKNGHYLSIEMRNGQVLYQYYLGGDKVQIRSTEMYNDGEWHTLEAIRQHQKGNLKIDGKVVAKHDGSDEFKSLMSNDQLFFGGYPPNLTHPYPTVTQKGFEGCIDYVIIHETSVDLVRNLQAFGVVPGCPVKFASLISLEHGKPGYVKLPNMTVTDNLQITLKFKTVTSNALIFAIVGKNENENIIHSHLSLVDGILVFESGNNIVTTSPVGTKFDDNEWHVVTATIDEKAINLDIERIDTYDTDNYNSKGAPLDIKSAFIYLGGTPSNLPFESHHEPFAGCIGDVTVNGVIINFANTTDRPNTILGKCRGGEPSGLPKVPEDSWPLPPLPIDNENYTDITENSIVDINPENVEPEPITAKPIEGRHNEKFNNVDGKESEEEITTPSTTTKSTTPFVPVYVDECRLPFEPAVDPDGAMGWRFGTQKDSRREYSSINGRYKYDFDFQINIKTIEDEGLIFYASGQNNDDLIALFIQHGRVNFKFDCGSGPALITNPVKINDNQWHTVQFKREQNYGELIVEDTRATGTAIGGEGEIDVNPPFYLGGVIPEKSSRIFKTLGMNKSFDGCLNNFMINGNPVGTPAEEIGLIPCSKKIEPGIFFYPSNNGSNFFKPVETFSVSKTMDIQMDIKPRSSSGHLLSVHGKKDFLILEMVSGTIRFMIKSNKGQTTIETSFKPPNPNSLCDGNWHNIRAIKQKNVLLLSVDHKAASPGIGLKNSAVVSTKSPIFIGGHVRLQLPLRGSTAQAQYVGCMNNIMIDNNPIKFDPSRTSGKVTTNVCPTI
ncbi:laminin subunit alpha [Leptopilina boulardi]|uniref:laminin subunit alpha n=1 Tax=Leptopilina boulardi TaxID=63433 RepID=UPI0021F52C16|nr:laminin subunit alpha [Leptopilina boulardi]